jgi:hypothetical protein
VLTTIADRSRRTAVRISLRLSEELARLRREDEGMTTLEVAVIAAALLAVALLLATIITNAVASHDSTIK